MTGPVVLEADRLYRFFHTGDDETLALRGVSLTVAQGELIAVSGRSGSGKSTLLACLAGLDEPDGGTVRLAGRRLNRRPEAERAAARAEGIGVLFQQENLVAHLSIAENVAIARRLGPGPTRDATDPLRRCGIAARARALPAELSGGELARAGLALAIANDPAIVLADEPTGELDRDNGRRVLALLRERTDDGGAVVVVTHDPEVARAADRQIHLHDGQIVA